MYIWVWCISIKDFNRQIDLKHTAKQRIKVPDDGSPLIGAGFTCKKVQFPSHKDGYEYCSATFHLFTPRLAPFFAFKPCTCANVSPSLCHPFDIHQTPNRGPLLQQHSKKCGIVVVG
jgi:hypothetical protein